MGRYLMIVGAASCRDEMLILRAWSGPDRGQVVHAHPCAPRHKHILCKKPLLQLFQQAASHLYRETNVVIEK